jgi:hypothetical protein
MNFYAFSKVEDLEYNKNQENQYLHMYGISYTPLSYFAGVWSETKNSLKNEVEELPSTSHFLAAKIVTNRSIRMFRR